MTSPSEVLRIVGHRPWPLPTGPWVMSQVWYDVLFAHWPISCSVVRPLVPAGLLLDTFEGEAWVSITPFHMDLRPRAIPVKGSVMHFPELNCRTYVVLGGKPGIYFFSLDAGSRLAVWGARMFYRLPYHKAEMRVRKEDGFHYSARRVDGAASFEAQYAPLPPIQQALPGSLQHWLTERYCLYTQSGKHIYRGEIHHAPWPLQEAICEIRQNSIAAAAGLQLPTNPLFQFARQLDVLIWPLHRIKQELGPLAEST